MMPICQTNENWPSPYSFTNGQNPLCIETNYNGLAETFIKNSNKDPFHYFNTVTTVHWTFPIEQDNLLTSSLQYDYLYWESPAFRIKQTAFSSIGGFLTLLSSTIKQWLWVMRIGYTIDPLSFNAKKNSIYHGTVEGQYSFTDFCNIHVGAISWCGMLDGGVWPILGLDCTFHNTLLAKMIYPKECSLVYKINKNFSTAIHYDCFKKPHSHPHRAIENNQDTIFKTFTNKAGLSFFLQQNWMEISLTAGWNFGGWIEIKDEKKDQSEKLFYKSSPYIQGKLRFNF